MSQAPLSLRTDSDSHSVPRSFALYIRTLAAAMPGRLVLAMIVDALGASPEGIGLLVLVPLLNHISIDAQQDSVGRVAG